MDGILSGRPGTSRVIVGNRNQEKIALICINRKYVNCLFKCNAKRVTIDDVDVAQITTVDLFHKCSSADFIQENGAAYQPTSRKRMPKMISSVSQSAVLSSFVAKPNDLSSNQGGISANQLREMVKNENSALTFSSSQSKKFIKSFSKDSFRCGALEFAQLPNFLHECKLADPEGIYLLSLVPVTYPAHFNTQLMFEYFVIIPSVSRHFFRSGNRILVIDGCHMYSKWDGILLAAVGTDGSHRNVVLALALVPIENKKYWEKFFHSLIDSFSDIHLVLSDKTKGLQGIQESIRARAESYVNQNLTQQQQQPSQLGTNSELRPTVFALCSLHCKRNSQLKGVHANAEFNRLARAATQEEFDFRFNQIKSTASAATCDYILSHKDEFSYMGLSKKQGLETNYGQVSTNPVEQCNAHMKTLRSSGPTTLCREFLASLASLYASRHANARDLKFNQHFMVMPDTLQLVKTNSDIMLKGKWTNRIVSLQYVSFGQQSANETFPQLTYLVAKDTEQYKVTLISNSDPTIKWHKKVLCSCIWTLEVGLPCRHAGFCLIYPKIDEAFKNIQQSPRFQYDLSFWYSPVYHTSTMIEQYNHVVNIPTIIEMKCHRIYPPKIFKPAGT